MSNGLYDYAEDVKKRLEDKDQEIKNLKERLKDFAKFRANDLNEIHKLKDIIRKQKTKWYKLSNEIYDRLEFCSDLIEDKEASQDTKLYGKYIILQELYDEVKNLEKENDNE